MALLFHFNANDFYQKAKMKPGISRLMLSCSSPILAKVRIIRLTTIKILLMGAIFREIQTGKNVR